MRNGTNDSFLIKLFGLICIGWPEKSKAEQKCALNVSVKRVDKVLYFCNTAND